MNGQDRENMDDNLRYCNILHTHISVTSMEQTVRYIDSHLEELRGRYICVSNVHTTVTAYRDPEYRKIQNKAAMNLPDGKPLSIVQKRRGYQNADRVPGPDLMPAIFRLSEQKGYRHFFYGSGQETLHALKTQLAARFPRLVVAGMYSPPYRPLTEEEDQEVVERINRCRPDFIWVGLGAPKQERWMAEHEHKVCGVMLGVGAGFDFHAGTVKRAPDWMQEWCMEWLYRIGQDPKRLLPRYLDTNFSFLFYSFKESRIRKKRARKCRKPFRIAMIGHKRIPSREGGVEIVVDELSCRMVKQGYQVDAYNRYGYHVSGKEFDEKRGKDYNGVRLITIPTPSSSALNAVVYSFLATVRALFGRYDVIHYHAEGPCIMLWIPKLFGIRVVATIHGLDWQRSKWGHFASNMLKLGEKIAARCADEIIVLSLNTKEYFKQIYGRQTVYIPNGIDRPEKKDACIIKERFGLQKDEYILFLARIVPEKGLHYLIEAFSRLDTRKKLVIAGGSSHSHEYTDHIASMAAADQRIVMTGFVQGQALEELYSNAYLFVLPSDVEGMAVSLLEAMSYGNCCLVSDIKENLEVVEDKACTFEKSNVDDLADKLEQLLQDTETVKKYGGESAAYICERFNWDDVVRQTLRLYRK